MAEEDKLSLLGGGGEEKKLKGEILMKMISLVSLVYIVKMKRFAICKGLVMHFLKF